MSDTSVGLGFGAEAGYTPAPRNGLNLGVKQTYEIDYVHPDGTSWHETIHNLVPNVALNAMLDILYGATAKFSALYTFLVTGPGASNTYAAGDTMSSHTGWAENVTYSDANRPTATFGSASGQSIANSGSPAVFNINGTATIAGCGLATSNTKSGTTGTLVGVGNFTGGDRAVASGGTLTVTVTATAATA
jgi:hypothetical protein